MLLKPNELLTIQKKLEIYDKIFEKIFERFDVLDNQLKVRPTKNKSCKYSDNDKIYLSIAGLSKAASIEDS